MCDVDGTLVGPSPDPTAAVVDACQRAADRGVAVGFATGRMRLAVEPLWRRLRVPGPHLLHDGAEVRYRGTTIASWPLPAPDLAALLSVVADQGIYLEIYNEAGYVVTERRPEAAPHWALLGSEPSATVASADEVLGPVLKCTAGLFPGEDTAAFVAAVDALGLRAGVAGSPLTPGITYVNVTSPEAGKGRALVAAAEHVGVPVAATAAIGDAANDLPMFAVVGTAVAMGQAPGDVRDAAHLVAPSVEDDGVAAAMDALTDSRAGARGH